MTDSPDQAEAPKTLAEILLDKNLLSQAQIELAIADQDINDIPLEEILLVRGWISQEKLYEVAPWLVPGSKLPAPPISKSGSFAKPGSGKTGSFSKPDLSKLAAMKPNAEPGPVVASFSAKDGVVTGGSSSNSSSAPAKDLPPATASATAKDSADKVAVPVSDKPQAPAATNNNSSEKKPQSTNGADKPAELPQPPLSTAGGDDLNKSQDIPLVAGTVSGGAKGVPKPGDTKEPPLNAHANPEVHVSPVKGDSEQNLKAYKEVLKKILALDKD